MRVGDLAARTNVSRSRIRFYESSGILPIPLRDANGYRRFDEQAVSILQFVERAQSLGFSLQEIGRHLHTAVTGKVRKAHLAWRVETKLAEVDAQIAALQAKRQELLELLSELHLASMGKE